MSHRACIPVLVAALLAGAALPALAQPCLNSAEPRQSAEGILTSHRMRDAAGNEQTVYILELGQPACLDGPGPSARIDAIRHVHLEIVDYTLFSALEQLAGKQVRVFGAVAAADPERHRAPVVIRAQQIDPVAKKGF